MALGELKAKKEDRIVALIGDASIVNGVSFEALNNLGLVKRQMLIVLNDNSMAIDPTQGAVAKYFSEMRLSHTYEDVRRTSRNILEHLPVIGKGMENALEKIKKGIRMTLPPSRLFESLNIPYFGPIDGHDIEVAGETSAGDGASGPSRDSACLYAKGQGFCPGRRRPANLSFDRAFQN